MMATRIRTLVAFFYFFIYLLTYLTKTVIYKQQNIILHVLPPKAKPIEPVAPQSPSWPVGLFFFNIKARENLVSLPSDNAKGQYRVIIL